MSALRLHLLEESAKDLSKVSARKLPLVQDHENAGDEDDDTVTNISEHDREQERECNDGKETWINLLIRSNTIAVHDGLEAFGELVRALECGRGFASVELVQNRRDTRAGLLL